MDKPNHEKLAYRLSQILIKLNQGERIYPHALAEEFGVNLRTVQRDMNERFAYLPLLKQDGYYQLESTYLGKLSTKDIEQFASLSGVRGLFPSLTDNFLADIFDKQMQTTMLVKGHNYEDITQKKELFQQIERAILSNHSVAIDFLKRGELQRYPSLDPYKLLNHKGIWYLVAKDGEKPKTFGFSKIINVQVLDTLYETDPDIERQLRTDDGIWFGEERKEVVVKVASDVAGYFKRRKLIANQIIEKELEDGGLIISTKISHMHQLLPIVRYWIPHIRIISPESVQQQLNQDLQSYIQNYHG